MQTFLPYSDFHKSASVLDNRRLGKQRVETLQLLQAQYNSESAWRNHPVFRMWMHNPLLLAIYGLAMCEEWTARGYEDNCRNKIIATLPKHHREYLSIPFIEEHLINVAMPFWYYYMNIFPQYRAVLKYKDPIYYEQFSENTIERISYPIFPMRGDTIENEIIEFDKISKCDFQSTATIHIDNHIINIEHIRKIPNSPYHEWRVDNTITL